MNTRNSFNEKLESIRHDIMVMAVKVEEDLDRAVAALKTNNVEQAEMVKANDAVINALQIRIEDETAMVIATEQPVAGDLRELVSVFKIAANLERAGDYTVHLAKAAIKLQCEPAFRFVEHLERMAAVCRDIMRLSINAYIARNAEAARDAAGLDNIIDMEHKELIAAVLKFIKKNPGLVKKAVRILNASGYLERFGDHITNICEGVIYMVESTREELN